MDLAQIEAFLVLCEELHFGRTAARLHVAPSRVSKLVAALERDVGAALFERTSRQVRTTALGRQLLADLGPAHAALRGALAAARTTARTASGTLRVGFTATTAGEVLTGLLARFARAHPQCAIEQVEVPVLDPYGPLRRDEVDVLVNWHYCDEPDLTLGPVIDRQARMLAMSAADPLARRAVVSVEDLGGRAIAAVTGLPPALHDVLHPRTTPSGVEIPRTVPVRTMTELFAQVAAGAIVHPSATGLQGVYTRPDVVWRPLTGLPPLALGLIWPTAARSGRVAALAALVESPV